MTLRLHKDTMNRFATIVPAAARRGVLASLTCSFLVMTGMTGMAGTTEMPGALTAQATAEETITIRSIAPVKSVFFFSADDVRGSVERFRKTPLFDLWNSETVQGAVAEDWTKFQEGLEERLQELGLPEDTLSWPVSVGFAVYLERNEEIDELEPVIVGIADWGDGADKMSAFFDASFNEIAKESADRVSTREIRGRRATILEIPTDPGDAGAFGGGPLGDLGTPDKLVYVRDGSRFLVATDADAMEDALTAIDVPPSKLITDEEDAREALSQLGSGDAIAVLRTGPLQPLVQEAQGGMMAMAAPMLSKLFGDIQAYGFSATVDGQVGQIDSAITIYTPGGRKGLLALLTPGPIGPAPSIVPSDAIGYGHLRIAFSEIMKIVESTVAGLPEMLAEEADPMLQLYGPTLTRAFASLGPDLHTYSSVSQPITDESQQTTIAISCSDEQAVLPLINLVAPQLGMASRDFLGQTIFSSEMVPVALGFGGGHMVIGTTANVEQALRTTGQGDAPGARSSAEKSAMALLPSRPVVGWGWTDTVAAFEVGRQLALAGPNEAETMDFVDEQGKVVTEVIGVEMPTKMLDTMRKMDSEFISRYVGPQLWQFAADNKGLVYRFSLLRPKTADPK